ncbi:MAG: 2-oxoacid:acceptor oxidoreductase subunit alpha [Planctomycetes bacterium]|nr:2-oxoacid:acceptor oxidoreductase subunit alpha [Planctomycetota bacterium]
MSPTVVNDFTVTVATVNGSGSASSNTILAKTVFRMGVPVTPKNLFPSNIAGLPTWFLIRVSEKGYQARTGTHEVVIALNAETVAKDAASVRKGGVLIVDEKIAGGITRDDIAVHKVPFAELVKPFAPDPRLRKLLANMIYVGVATDLLGLDRETVMKVVADQFAGREKIVKLNQEVVKVGLEYSRDTFDAAKCPFKVESRDLTRDKLFIEGNAAAALGALMGGCTFVGWYPITPSSSVCEELIHLAKEHRVVGGDHRFAAVQAEDELASLGLVLGAGWAGARAMTATAGPGISLMAEFAGFGYYAEIPAVVMDIQRVGPSTGMPTRTQQCDVSSCLNLSHGDTGHIVLLPGGIDEIYEQSQQAFDLAERYQTPVFLLSDLDMGMNYWMAERFAYPERPFDRGKVLDAEQLAQVKAFARYKDVDGDGIPYRTLPGTHHALAPYFTRGSGHTETAAYTEDSDEYQKVVDRIKRKIDGSVRDTPAPIHEGDPDCDVGVLHYGSTRFAVEEARDMLAADGIATKAMRVRALPLHAEVVEFVQSCRVVYVVEQNRDGQMADIVRLKVPGSAGLIKKVLYYAGMPLSATTVVEQITADQREPSHV